MTNYERIKAMSVEEMADLLDEITEACSDIGGGYHCDKCPIGKNNKYRCDIRGWLERECDT